MSDLRDILNINSAAYNAGFQAGAEAMRERAAKAITECYLFDAKVREVLLSCAAAIRALPVEE